MTDPVTASVRIAAPPSVVAAPMRAMSIPLFISTGRS